MEEIKIYLQQLGMKITDEFAQELTKFQYKSFKKGEFYVAEGKTAKHIAFIKKGKIRHFYNIDGKEYTRWVSLEHNFVTAFTSFVRQVPSLETLECIEPCELFLLGRDTFYQIKNEYPEMQQLWTLSLENEMIGYEDRVFQLITTDSEKRYLDFLEKYPTHAQQVPQKYIASMLGIEPRHLSRVRKKLATKPK